MVERRDGDTVPSATQAQLKMWWERIRRYAEKTWWMPLLYRVLEDRVMGWANAGIDSAIALTPSPGWAKVIHTIQNAAIAFDNLGGGFFWNLVALTILSILILAYWETRPKEREGSDSSGKLIAPTERNLSEPQRRQLSADARKASRFTLDQYIQQGYPLLLLYQGQLEASVEPWHRWMRNVSNYLRTDLGESYVARWDNRDGLNTFFSSSLAVPESNRRICIDLSYRLQRLGEFYRELENKA